MNNGSEMKVEPEVECKEEFGIKEECLEHDIEIEEDNPSCTAEGSCQNVHKISMVIFGKLML